MTTFIWWLLIYSLTVLISEAVVVWGLRTMKNQDSFKNIVDNPLVNYRTAVFALALIPVINLLVAGTVVRTAIMYLKAKKKMRMIANKLRSIGDRNPDLNAKIAPLADAIENLPDQNIN
jgi:hypothetical protein